MNAAEYRSLEAAFFEAIKNGDIPAAKPFLEGFFTRDTFKDAFNRMSADSQNAYGRKILLAASGFVPQEKLPDLMKEIKDIAPQETHRAVKEYVETFRVPGL